LSGSGLLLIRLQYYASENPKGDDILTFFPLPNNSIPLPFLAVVTNVTFSGMMENIKSQQT